MDVPVGSTKLQIDLTCPKDQGYKAQDFTLQFYNPNAVIDSFTQTEAPSLDGEETVYEDVNEKNWCDRCIQVGTPYSQLHLVQGSSQELTSHVDNIKSLREDVQRLDQSDQQQLAQPSSRDMDAASSCGSAESVLSPHIQKLCSRLYREGKEVLVLTEQHLLWNHQSPSLKLVPVTSPGQEDNLDGGDQFKALGDAIPCKETALELLRLRRQLDSLCIQKRYLLRLLCGYQALEETSLSTLERLGACTPPLLPAERGFLTGNAKKKPASFRVAALAVVSMIRLSKMYKTFRDFQFRQFQGFSNQRWSDPAAMGLSLLPGCFSQGPSPSESNRNVRASQTRSTNSFKSMWTG